MVSIMEEEYRTIERFKESCLKEYLNTPRTCPAYFIYLTYAIIPARNQIHRMKLSYLHYIMQQPQDSILGQVFLADTNNPTEGDWRSTLKLIEYYNLGVMLKQIGAMKRDKFKDLVYSKIIHHVFEGLLEQQRGAKKG